MISSTEDAMVKKALTTSTGIIWDLSSKFIGSIGKKYILIPRDHYAGMPNNEVYADVSHATWTWLNIFIVNRPAVIIWLVLAAVIGINIIFPNKYSW